MSKLIVLIGESASGKSTIESKLVETGRYNKAVSDTSRAMRSGEVNGEDYHFVSDEEFESRFKDGEYIEHTEYNGWNYGVRKSEIEDSTLPIVLVANPHGYRQIKDSNLDVISFHIDVDWRTRAKRLIDRGDDLMEIFRRLISDTDSFQGIGSDVDYIIEGGNDKKIEDIIYQIESKINQNEN